MWQWLSDRWNSVPPNYQVYILSAINTFIGTFISVFLVSITTVPLQTILTAGFWLSLLATAIRAGVKAISEALQVKFPVAATPPTILSAKP